MGMSWAAYTLAGAKPVSYAAWAADFAYQKDTVVYNDSAWCPVRDWPPKAMIPQIYPEGTDTWSQHWKLVSALDKSRTRSNPDGSDIKFTFNLISGLMVPVWPMGWESRESKFGYWVPNEKDYPDGKVLHTKIARAWGREMLIWSDKENGTLFQDSYIGDAFREAKDLGHEIGNHTIDHMESNSSLPKTYMFDGADNALDDVMPWGETIDEAALYGHTRGATADTMGWKINAGKIISKEAWRSAIDIGEKQLDEYMDVSVAKGNCFSFRSPRLEVNSNLYFALKEAGYQYDCGLEEGYEEDRDGSNFVWPYTMDNGTPNVYTQKINGERMSIDSTPAGFWEVPVNCFIVPAHLRPGIFTKYHQISSGAGEAWTKDPVLAAKDSTDWCGEGGGKITGFDFNMFILWGLSKAEFVETMKSNLDMRLAANKAPVQYGCHTDYYTPIYDNATLCNDFNKNSYGLVISKGWNSWKDRKDAVTEFIDYAISKGAYVVTGHQLVEEMKAYQARDIIGAKNTYAGATWEFYEYLGSSTAQAAFTGTITNAAITMAGGQEESCGYEYWAGAGSFSAVDHISLTYTTTNPLLVKLVGPTGKTWDALLNNIGPETKSGNIPISAFRNADKSPVPLSSIEAVDIEVVNMDSLNKPASLSIKEFSTYGGAVGINAPGVRSAALLSLGTMSSRSLSFNAPVAGKYEVQVYTLNGRMIQSISKEVAAAGMVSAGFTVDLAPQMYLVKIKGADTRELVTKTAVSAKF